MARLWILALSHTLLLLALSSPAVLRAQEPLVARFSPPGNSAAVVEHVALEKTPGGPAGAIPRSLPDKASSNQGASKSVHFLNPGTCLLRFEPPRVAGEDWPDAGDSPSNLEGHFAGAYGEPDSINASLAWRREFQRLRKSDQVSELDLYSIPDAFSGSDPGGNTRLGGGSRNPFELRLNFENRPDYLPALQYQPMIDNSPRPPSARNRAFWNLVEKESYRQIRRYMKKLWRQQFQASPSMTYEFYQSRLTQINNIGKDDEELDLYNTDYYSNQFRDDLLNQQDLEGERELYLVEWGPLRLNDRGSIHFDLRALFAPDPPSGGENAIGGLKLFSSDGTKSEKKESALFNGRHYKWHTNFHINYNPMAAIRANDPLEGIRSYGGSVEVDFLSDILKRQLFSTEFEVDVRKDGEVVFFVNWVIKGR